MSPNEIMNILGMVLSIIPPPAPPAYYPPDYYQEPPAYYQGTPQGYRYVPGVGIMPRPYRMSPPVAIVPPRDIPQYRPPVAILPAVAKIIPKNIEKKPLVQSPQKSHAENKFIPSRQSPPSDVIVPNDGYETQSLPKGKMKLENGRFKYYKDDEKE